MKLYLELKKGLSKAKAPITKRKVSCVLESENGNYYYGWNIEKTKNNILHAEANALSHLIGKENIKNIHLMANGNMVESIKRAIPCEGCTRILSKWVTKTAQIYLHSNHIPNKKYKASFKDFEKSYQALKKFKKINFSELKKYLKNNTTLTNRDLKFLLLLCLVAKKHNKEFPNQKFKMYLTGTAGGRSGPKRLFVKSVIGKDYQDLDLLLIFPKNYPRYTDRFIKDSYKKVLLESGIKKPKIRSSIKPPYKLEEEEWKSKNFLFRREYILKTEHGFPSLDISVGRILGDTITKQYLDKNWFIQLI